MKKIVPILIETILATLFCCVFGVLITIALQLHYYSGPVGSSISLQRLAYSFVFSFIVIVIPLGFFNLLKYYLNQKGAK